MAKKSASKKPRTGTAKRAADLEGLRERITGLVAARAMAIARGALNDAENKVNVAAMKYLFEMIGLYPRRADEEPKEEKPEFVDILLKKMGLPPEPSAEEAGQGEEVRMG